MPKAPARSVELGRVVSSASRGFGKFVIIIPILAIAYAEIILPLMMYADAGAPAGAGGLWTPAQETILKAPNMAHRIFWPPLAAISIILAIRNWSRLTLPPHIIFLFAYLAFAGISVLWAYKPEYSSVRFVQQAMIITSIVLPALLAARTVDMMRGVFLVFLLALIVNLFFVLDQKPMILENGRIGYAGYFTFKGILGECAAFALMLSFHEILYPGWRRAFGIIAIGISIYLFVMSDSKGSVAFACLAPLLAGLILFISKKMRVSLAVLLAPIPIFYAVLSKIVPNLINRISWHVYGNYNLTGRTDIWDFVNSEIARSPLFGWGYQSFWLVGPDAPSIVDAPGWIKDMPSAHNGYLDTRLDMGYIGLTLLIIFIFATLHAIGRIRETTRAWLLLTLALFLILTNFLESGWMHAYDMLWLMFLIVAAEAGRFWQPSFRGVPAPIRRSPIMVRRPGFARAKY